MKKVFVFIFILCGVLSALCKSDALTRLWIKHLSTDARNTHNAPDRALSRDGGDDGDETADSTQTAPYLPLLVQIESDDMIDSLTAAGAIIYNRRADILLASIPRDTLGILDSPGILNIGTCAMTQPAMNVARTFCQVDAAQSGGDMLYKPFDGKGVVAGFSDTGFDATNPAFAGRIKAIHDYDAARGEHRSATTASEIAEWTTDNADQMHGTFVANILAGNMPGSQYYGVATGADLVATTSRLTDVGILAGVEDIIAYAKEAGKPAVINLSLASQLGPHDGSDLVCRYLSECAKDAVICLSAGNDGYNNIFATKQLTNSNDIYRVAVNDFATWCGFDVYGITDLWSIDSTPFDFRVEVYDKEENRVCYASEWVSATDSVASLEINPEDNPEWGQFFTGQVLVEAALCDLNNRYNASVLYNTHTEEQITGHSWARYCTTLAIKGIDGMPPTTVDLFSDGSQTFFGTVRDGGITPSPKGSISNLCTAEGVVSVGSMNSRAFTPLLSGGERDHNITVGTVSNYTSYSDVPTIKPLPHFCAPGTYIVSALSSQYAETNPDILDIAAASTVADGRDWYWIAECGTSFASPIAAGIIAMWLEADPTLDAERVLSTVRATADTDFPDYGKPQWGMGEIMAVDGLKKVMADAGIESPMSGTYIDAESRIYSLDGMEMPSGSPLTPGVYIMKTGSTVRKIYKINF